jgi:hypothetical protein
MDRDNRKEQYTTMLKDVVAAGSTSAAPSSCLLNIARISEDLEDWTSLVMLLDVPLPPETPDWSKQYFAMLRYVCDHWDEYSVLKVYVSQLRWSHWLLSSQHAGDPVSGFWSAEGILVNEGTRLTVSFKMRKICRLQTSTPKS